MTNSTDLGQLLAQAAAEGIDLGRHSVTAWTKEPGGLTHLLVVGWPRLTRCSTGGVLQQPVEVTVGDLVGRNLCPKCLSADGAQRRVLHGDQDLLDFYVLVNDTRTRLAELNETSTPEQLLRVLQDAHELDYETSMLSQSENELSGDGALKRGCTELVEQATRTVQALARTVHNQDLVRTLVPEPVESRFGDIYRATGTHLYLNWNTRNLNVLLLGADALCCLILFGYQVSSPQRPFGVYGPRHIVSYLLQNIHMYVDVVASTNRELSRAEIETAAGLYDPDNERFEDFENALEAAAAIHA